MLELAPRETPIIDTLLPGNLPRELPHNFLRDWTWASIAAVNTDVAWQTMPALDPKVPIDQLVTGRSFVGPLGAQWIYASVPMLLVATADTVYHKYKGKPLTSQTLAKIWAPACAASLAIPMWNLAQTIGVHIGTMSPYFQHSGLWYGASIAAGMIAAPFVGIFEGFTQWAVKYLVDVATNPVTKAMWRQDPCLMLKLLIKEFLLNITIGAIPGAIWQIVFFFALAALITALGPVSGIILTALLVALCVMVANYGCTHLINRVSAAIDRTMGWDMQFQQRLTQIHTLPLTLNTPIKV